jgi:SET domain-containing protein
MVIFEESDDRFYIATSNIPNAGRGLFAARQIKQGEVLFVSGVLVERGSEADKTTCFLDAYKFAADPQLKNNEIDYGKYVICPLGYAAFANHSDNENNVEIRYNGDEFLHGKSLHTAKVFYFFLRDVEKNEEILANYGNRI